MTSPQPTAVCTFPPPPEYAKQYTDENIAKKCVLPPPPVPSSYTAFGEEYNFNEDMIRSLNSQKMQQLYGNGSDWRSELKKLNRSVIAAFLDLLYILIKCPNHPERSEKINNLRVLFINMHHLINEYRPMQARDCLKIIMREQKQVIDNVIENFRFHLNIGREVLKNCIQDIPILADLSSDAELQKLIEKGNLASACEFVMRDVKVEPEESVGAVARPSVQQRQEAAMRDLTFLRTTDKEVGSLRFSDIKRI